MHKASSTLLLQVVSKVMSCCSEECIPPVADAAVYFMEEQNLESAKRESPHDVTKKVKGHITIDQASFLVIKFEEL